MAGFIFFRKAMNPDLLRSLDKYVGSTCCRLLSVFSKAGYSATVPLPAPRDLAIIKLTEMGSTVLAIPALRELRRAWPDARWHVVVFRNSRSILDLLQLTPAENIIELDDRSISRLLFSAWRAMFRLRRIRASVCFDFDFFSRLTAVFAWLTCRGARIGYQPFHAAARERGRLLTHRVVYSPTHHVSMCYLALVRTAICASPGEPFYRGSLDDADVSLPRYQPREEDTQLIRQLLRDHGVEDNSSLVLMNTNASELLPLRRWPRERFEALIRKILAHDSRIRVALVGSAADAPEAQIVHAAVADARLINLAGRTTLAGFLALCDRASAMVCNDGGPAHFAGLADLPSVVLFGPENPALYRPLTGPCRIVYRALPCSPCVHVFNAKKSACQRAICLESITVDEVMKALLELPARKELPAA